MKISILSPSPGATLPEVLVQLNSTCAYAIVESCGGAAVSSRHTSDHQRPHTFPIPLALASTHSTRSRFTPLVPSIPFHTRTPAHINSEWMLKSSRRSSTSQCLLCLTTLVYPSISLTNSRIRDAPHSVPSHHSLNLISHSSNNHQVDSGQGRPQR